MTTEVADSYKLLVIQGWLHGFQKIEFTKMLRRELGYSLTVAKTTTDKILEHERVELLVSDSQNELLSRLSSELGAVVVTQDSLHDKGSLCLQHD